VSIAYPWCTITAKEKRGNVMSNRGVNISSVLWHITCKSWSVLIQYCTGFTWLYGVHTIAEFFVHRCIVFTIHEMGVRCIYGLCYVPVACSIDDTATGCLPILQLIHIIIIIIIIIITFSQTHNLNAIVLRNVNGGRKTCSEFTSQIYKQPMPPATHL